VRLQRYNLVVGLLLLWAFSCQAKADDQPLSQMFDANGVRIHYLVQGAGEAVVPIHGWYSSATINWRLPGTIAPLARDHQVIALDLPGYGQSDKPNDARAYGAQWVKDVVLLLDHLDIHKAHVVGYSMGGIVALKFVAEHPDRVLSGILGGMGWMPQDGALQKVWSICGASARAVGELAVSEEASRATRVPVLILIGDRDPMRQLYVAPLQRVRDDWPVVEIRDAGHLNCIFKQQFIDEVVGWVDANRPQ
jgi:pimeloyl-ACP methyl ester carboxylesterase